MITDNLIDLILDTLEAELTYIGMGTGAAPDAADDLLDTEVERKACSYLRDGNTTVLDAYWDETEGNGVTYTNAGAFYDGNASVETGHLGAGGVINAAKTNKQSLTVSIEINVEEL